MALARLRLPSLLKLADPGWLRALGERCHPGLVFFYPSHCQADTDSRNGFWCRMPLKGAPIEGGPLCERVPL